MTLAIKGFVCLKTPPRSDGTGVLDMTSSPKIDPADVKESYRAGGPKRILKMSQKRHSVDQIVSKLHRADVELGKGKKVLRYMAKTADEMIGGSE